MSKRLMVLVGVLLVSVGAGGALAAKQLLSVNIDEGATVQMSVPPGAVISSVTRLAPEDAPLKLLVVYHVPGEGSAQFQFLKMDITEGSPAPQPQTCATGSPVPGWVCVAGGNWVPPSHPLAKR